MGAIAKYPITATPENVVALSVCRYITVMEDMATMGWPTVEIVIEKPGDGGPGASTTTMLLQPGLRYTFVPTGHRGFFNPGEIVGTVATATGSANCIQDEL